MFTCSSKGEAPGGVEEGVVLAVVVLLAGGAVRWHQEGPGGAAHAAALNPLQPCAYGPIRCISRQSDNLLRI